MLDIVTAELAVLLASASGAAGWLIGDMRGAQRARQLYRDCHDEAAHWADGGLALGAPSTGPLPHRSGPWLQPREMDGIHPKEAQAPLTQQESLLVRQRRFRREAFASMPPLAELRAEAAAIRESARDAERGLDNHRRSECDPHDARAARDRFAANAHALKDYGEAIRTLQHVNRSMAQRYGEPGQTQPHKRASNGESDRPYDLPIIADAAPLELCARGDDLADAREHRAYRRYQQHGEHGLDSDAARRFA